MNKWNPGVKGPGFPYKLLKENLVKECLKENFIKEFLNKFILKEFTKKSGDPWIV